MWLRVFGKHEYLVYTKSEETVSFEGLTNITFLPFIFCSSVLHSQPTDQMSQEGSSQQNSSGSSSPSKGPGVMRARRGFLITWCVS